MIDDKKSEYSELNKVNKKLDNFLFVQNIQNLSLDC